MAFTPKDWKDDPDHTTPITAAALEDLESRVAGYTDSEITTLGTVVTQDGLTVGGDTAGNTALQSLISQLETAGIITDATTSSGGSPPTSPALTDYDAMIVADSPDRYWKLQELSGSTASDEMDNGAGTYSSMSLDQVGPNGPGGLLAQAVSPNTAGTYPCIDTGYNPWTNDSVTVEGWYYFNGDNTNSGFFGGPSWAGGNSLYVYNGSTGGVEMDFGGIIKRRWADATVPVDEWFHMMLVTDDSADQADLYINGELATPTATNSFTYTSGEFVIGNQSSSDTGTGSTDNYWDGRFAAVAVYGDIELTQGDARRRYLSLAPIFTKPDFDTGSFYGWNLGGVGSADEAPPNGGADYVSTQGTLTNDSAYAAKVSYTGAVYRSELVLGGLGDTLWYPTKFYNGVKFSVTFDIYVETMDWGDAGKHNLFMQFKDGGGSPPMGLQLWDETSPDNPPGLHNSGTAMTGSDDYLASLATGTWHNIRWDINVGTASNGWYYLYLNDTLVDSSTGVTNFTAGDYAYIKMGLYRGTLLTNQSTIYFDNFALYAYADEAPTDTTP